MSEKRQRPRKQKKKSNVSSPPPAAPTTPPSTTNQTTTNNTRTTRVCIKNLPPSFTTSTKLSSHLLSTCPSLLLTDVKLLKTKNGIHRKIAFVGCKTPQMADLIVKEFDQSYALTSKLIVEKAFPKKMKDGGGGVGEYYRPWSKHSKGSSRYQQKHSSSVSSNVNDAEEKNKEEEEEEEKGNKERKKSKEEEAIEQKKLEFLSVMGVAPTARNNKENSSKAKFWANDDGILLPPEKNKEKVDDEKSTFTKTRSNHDHDNERSNDESSSSEEESEEEEEENDLDSVDSGGAGANVMNNMSDMDFLRSKVITQDNLTDDDDNDDNEEEEKEEKKKQEKGDGNDSSSVPSSSSSSEEESDSSDDDSDVDRDKNNDNNNKNNNNTSSNNEQQQQQDKYSNIINNINNNNKKMTPSRLFIRNLPFTTTEEELVDLFSPYGTIVECHVPVDDLKRSKGYAFVKFTYDVEAMNAMEELDKVDFQGRLIHILPARKGMHEDQDEDDDEDDDDNDDDNDNEKKEKTHKQTQMQNRQKTASTTTHNLLSSFLRTDTILNNLSSRYNLQKSEDLLNVKDSLKSGDAAVRLALAETKIIEENRDYFAQEGIDLNVLANHSAVVNTTTTTTNENDNKTKNATQKIKRSTTMILLKNLPFDTTLEEIQKLCHAAASSPIASPPNKILLPPSKSVALLMYGHVTDAKRAFRKLAYKKFKHVPLYLEWAPLAAAVSAIKSEENKESRKEVENGANEKDTSSSPSTTTTTTTTTTNSMKKDEIMNDMKEEEDVEIPSNAVSHTIYIKNLNFKTTESQLFSTFSEHLGKQNILAVKIPTKAAPIKQQQQQQQHPKKQQRQSLSMGFGFVECTTLDIVKRAVTKLQGIVLDGHALELKISTKSLATTNNKTKSTISNKKNNKNTKLMVRNVPFEATRKEILQLFGSFGHLKKVRLPKKFNGSHRGFAFVEFVTSQEASNAMTSLSSTHLYGRHLVLEWAEEEDTTNDLEVVRSKMKRDADVVVGSGGVGGEKHKKRSIISGKGVDLDGPRMNKKIRFT